MTILIKVVTFLTVVVLLADIRRLLTCTHTHHTYTNTHTHTLTFTGKVSPCLVVDGRGQDEFKREFRRWRKSTMHPTKLTKKMLASELLVSNV